MYLLEGCGLIEGRARRMIWIKLVREIHQHGCQTKLLFFHNGLHFWRRMNDKSIQKNMEI